MMKSKRPSPALIETKTNMAELAVLGITLPRWLVSLSLGFLFGVSIALIGVWQRAAR